MSEPVKYTFPYATFNVSPFPNSRRVMAVYRPVIPVTLLHGGRFVQYAALLDSGSDYNIFHGDIATYLGIKLTTGSRQNIMGIGGKIKGYEHKLHLKIGAYKYLARLTFSNQLPENTLAVLGARGFFNQFTVTLDYRTNK